MCSTVMSGMPHEQPSSVLTNTVSLWRWDCWNAIIEVISALTHVMIHFLIHQGLKWGNLWSIFHIFAPLKHPFMFFLCAYISWCLTGRGYCLDIFHHHSCLLNIGESMKCFILHADDAQFKLSSHSNFSSKMLNCNFYLLSVTSFWNLSRL